MHCGQCHAENRKGSRFCAECGKSLTDACPACEFANYPDAKFCGGCGKALSPTAISPDKHRVRKHEALGAERRQLTVMFCDLVGSTALAERLDPEDLREVIRDYQNLAGQVIARYEGFIARYMGDGILVYFGYPRAHEDDAARAIYAGLDLVEAMNAHVGVSGMQGEPLAVRVGIASGLVVVGDLIGTGASEEAAVVGETPNLAARLQALTEPNTVVVAGHTHRLAGGLFEYADRGTHRLRGFSEPMHAWQVIGESDAESRFDAAHGFGLTALVGRDEEIDLLLRRWQRAKEGEGQVVLIAGEPGIGKSRIAQALRERVSGEPHTRLRYQCSPYHTNSALYPIINQIERAAKFARKDSPDTKLDKLEALLALSAMPVHEVMPLFAALLSIPVDDRYPPLTLSSERLKEETLEAMMHQLLGLTACQPVLFILEDAHWIDPTTIELLDLTVDRVQNARALVIITYRPEFTPTWTGAAHVTTLTINRLSKKLGVTMVENVAGRKKLPEELYERIVDKTDGVPLFIEEATKTIIESDFLEEKNGADVLADSPRSLVIPATLRDSLMARLDHLGRAKEVAQIGATIGREFSYDLLAAVSEIDKQELEDALDQLTQSQLVLRHGAPRDATYHFKHALVQDTAYESLLRSKRQQLHARIASVLEQRFPETATAKPELLAHYCTEAGETDKAVSYWLKAGRRASDRSANAEAAGHLRRGLQEVDKLPDTPQRKRRQLELLIALGPPLITTQGPGTAHVQQVYAHALELCTELPESEEHFSAYWGWWRVSMNHQSGLKRANKLLALAQKLGETSFVLQAHHCQWATLFMLGDQEACCHHIEEGLKLYDPQRHRSHASIYGGHDARVCAYGEYALASWLLGYPDRALESVSRAVSWAEELSHAASLAHAKDYELMLHRYRREASTVYAKAEEMNAFSLAQGMPDYLAKSIIFRGWALATMGNAEQGLEDMRAGLSDLQQIGTREDFPVFFDMLAAGCLMAEHVGEGIDQVNIALAEAERMGMRYWMAELHRRKANSLLPLSDDESQAELHLKRACDIAREQHAKSLELRAALDLARFKQRMGRTDEAQDLVLPIYETFTEGFDTVDLQDARTFLSTQTTKH